MKRKLVLMAFMVISVLAMMAPCFASEIYPDTLDNGNLVLVDAHRGVGTYADRSSVVVQKYSPPDYQIAINVISVIFSEDYYGVQKTYRKGPYTKDKVSTHYFRYNWNRKSVAFLNYMNVWVDWDINRDNCHADGDPFVPNTAETAFVSAYNMRFYGNTNGYNPLSKQYYRVISDDFYRDLGI